MKKKTKNFFFIATAVRLYFLMTFKKNVYVFEHFNEIQAVFLVSSIYLSVFRIQHLSISYLISYLDLNFLNEVMNVFFLLSCKFLNSLIISVNRSYSLYWAHGYAIILIFNDVKTILDKLSFIFFDILAIIHIRQNLIKNKNNFGFFYIIKIHEIIDFGLIFQINNKKSICGLQRLQPFFEYGPLFYIIILFT
ncbi:hypothetical protein AGLY_014596, partial [Aphis glycines]